MKDFGSLSHCMTDGDPESIARERSLRRKSLVTSLGFEMAVVTLLLLYPLLSPGGLGRQLELLPLPPVRYSPVPSADRNPNHPSRSVPSAMRPFIYDPLNPGHPITHSERGEAFDNSQLEEPGFLFGVSPTIQSAITPIVPPPAPATNKPPRISKGTMDASLVHRVEPEYPILAKAIRLSGTVRLHAIVGVDGTVHELQVLSGSPILATAARAAVSQWRYEPTRLNGEPVEVETFITVNFVLN